MVQQQVGPAIEMVDECAIDKQLAPRSDFDRFLGDSDAGKTDTTIK